MQTGEVILNDRETLKLISKQKSHQFEIWYVYLYQDNYLYSCSDDFSFKCFDLRDDPISQRYSCKKHDAGVTWITKEEEFQVMTGSYDGTIRIWDERNMKYEVASLNTEGKSVWDIKFNKKAHKSNVSFGVASIYDGYLFAEHQDQKSIYTGYSQDNFSLDQFSLKEYKGHESICYAFEFIPDSDLILTSSFYDSTLHLIQCQ
ncbi:UNKNOWN [Stylonychia lemnae]|uniref:methylated diphthine methylhydrolase n=1 Tax=Stylonychia lemnae TaxID=5949 RepID=A0A078ABX1_STYLE|nr:UNKNOWN [Stylonychia lemnae]|eukprot:CDW79351.1 UNKNOWN [Stylonychia lemnae]